jgi:hypothetical protein
LGVLVAFVAVGALAGAAPAHSRPTHACPTFTGPYDNLIHSRDFRVAGISCAVGKQVVEKCSSLGTRCQVRHVIWRCHGARIPGEDRCTAGSKVAEIFWED